MLQTVVAGRTAVGLHAYGADGKAEVVHHDQEVLQGNLFLLHPVAYGISAQVHVGAGLEQHQLGVLGAAMRHKAIPLVLERGLAGLRQRVHDVETDVMTCAFVFRSDVSETHNEVFHIVTRLLSGFEK